MKMSPIMHRTPGRPTSILFILFWKYSGAEVIPKGSFRKQYLPNGVMNVVGSSELGERGICQNPELASSFVKTFVKTFAPASLPRVWSTEGRSCFSLCTLSLSLVKSTQMRTSCFFILSPSPGTPFVFATTTMPAHQSVGFATLRITQRSSICWSSLLTISSNGIETRHGVVIANGWESLRSLISYCPEIFPKPSNSFGWSHL